MSINVTLGGNDNVVETFIYGTVGTLAVQILAAATLNPVSRRPGRQRLRVHNPSSTNSLAMTLDGTTPVVNGQGYTLPPYGTYDDTVQVSQGALTLIGSGSGSPYTISIF